MTERTSEADRDHLQDGTTYRTKLLIGNKIKKSIAVSNQLNVVNCQYSCGPFHEHNGSIPRCIEVLQSGTTYRTKTGRKFRYFWNCCLQNSDAAIANHNFSSKTLNNKSIVSTKNFSSQKYLKVS